jgi:hypothetical protein
MYGSADPDLYQNVTDPQHCTVKKKTYPSSLSDSLWLEADVCMRKMSPEGCACVCVCVCACACACVCRLPVKHLTAAKLVPVISGLQDSSAQAPAGKQETRGEEALGRGSLLYIQHIFPLMLEQLQKRYF